MTTTSTYPFKWVPSPPELEATKKRLFEADSNQIDGVVASPWNFFMPKTMLEDFDKIYSFEVRPDDVWILTYPKCGTTWTQEMVWQIMNNVDLKTASEKPLFSRSPFLEIQTLAPDRDKFTMMYQQLMDSKNPDPEQVEAMTAMKENLFNSIERTAKLDSSTSPRVIKTHLPLEMLPPNLLDTARVIFVGRNPKDCCVSYYHHITSIFPHYKFKGGFEDFAGMFIRDELEYGSYWDILKSCYRKKDHPNMKILWFEDMKANQIEVIRDVAKFLNKHLTEYRVLKLDDHLHIDNFRKFMTSAQSDPFYPSYGKFLRKGKVGDWKNYFNSNTNKDWNQWIAKHLDGTDIQLSFD